MQSTQPRANVAVVIYTKGGDAYDCIRMIWKSNKKQKEVKNHNFQRTVFRTQAPEVDGRSDNDDREKTRNIGSQREQMAVAGRSGVKHPPDQQHAIL